MASLTIRGKAPAFITYTVDAPLQTRDGKWNCCYQESGGEWKPYFTNRYDTPHDATMAAVSNILVALEMRGG